jgi:hypothetical protein
MLIWPHSKDLRSPDLGFSRSLHGDVLLLRLLSKSSGHTTLLLLGIDRAINLILGREVSRARLAET